MRTVPREQVIDSVDGAYRNVKRVGVRLRRKTRLEEKLRGQLPRRGCHISQSHLLDQRHPRVRKHLIATKSFFDDDRRCEESEVPPPALPPFACQFLVSGDDEISLVPARRQVADNAGFDVRASEHASKLP